MGQKITVVVDPEVTHEIGIWKGLSGEELGIKLGGKIILCTLVRPAVPKYCTKEFGGREEKEQTTVQGDERGFLGIGKQKIFLKRSSMDREGGT